MRRSAYASWVAPLLCAAVFTACGDNPTTAVPDAPPVDLGADAIVDTPADGLSDDAADAGPEASADVVDESHDVALDAADVAIDAAPDTLADGTADTPADTTPDATMDATPDATMDATPDATMDATPDATCPVGQSPCGGRCVDTTIDPMHCGACGMACMTGLSCVAGTCRVVCPSGQTACGSSCRDIQTDRAHCGACDAACAAGEACAAGRCVLDCPTGQTPCAGACRTLATDVAHCGACGRTCAVDHGTPSCSAGVCAVARCDSGYGDCDMSAANGCEVDTRVSNTHCGTCGHACGSEHACRDGACVYTVPVSCGAILRATPASASGAYTIDPDGVGGMAPIRVWCDMSTDGGGWMLVARLGEATPSSARGDLRSDRTTSALVSDAPPGSTEFSSWDVGRFESHGARWSVRVVVDTANNGTHAQSTYLRPRAGATITPGIAGSNWLDTATPAAVEYLTRSSNLGQRNRTWLPVQGFDRTSATVYLLTYRRASSSDPCLDSAGENRLCHAPAGGITNEPGLTGTYTAAFSNSDGVAHTWGRRATYWLRDSACAPDLGDCDGDASNGCEAPLRDSAAHCGACGRACTTGQVCILGACRAPYPRNCQERLRMDATATTGVHTIDPDGPGGIDPFMAHCDMTQDGGGWTLLGSGSWWTSSADTVTAPGANALLSDARLAAVRTTTGGLYRLGDGAQRLFIEDRGAYFGAATAGAGRHYWRTDSASVRCATSYDAVMRDALTLTTAHDVSCDPRGVGSHTCGVAAGWILWHDSDTYNLSGRHPCAFGTADYPTGRALDTLRVR